MINAMQVLQQVVLQPTPFCNLACDYCYLPNRGDRSVMSEAVLDAAMKFVVQSGLTGPALDLRWHAGEPLAVGLAFYQSALPRTSQHLAQSTKVRHSVQTNGVLINRDWAQLFAEHAVRVGVSLDGPAIIHDRHRVTRRGRGTFDRVVAGIAKLCAEGLKYDVISVVTQDTLRNADAFMKFFEQLPGLQTLGINVEESEGDHQSRLLTSADASANYRAFLRELWQWSRATGISIREFSAQAALAAHALHGEARNTQNVAFATLTVGANGDLATYSPELLGLRHPELGNAAIGNVMIDSVDSILASVQFADLHAKITAGVEACRKSCAYFRVCGGGAPVNKLFENGSLSSTVTAYCTLNVKTVTDVVLEGLTTKSRSREVH